MEFIDLSFQVGKSTLDRQEFGGRPSLRTVPWDPHACSPLCMSALLTLC